MTTTETPAARLAKAEQQAAEARAEMETQQAEAEQQRQAHLDEHDRQLVLGWEEREAAIQADEQAAWRRFTAAVANDPVFSEWIAWKSGRERRRVLRSEVSSAIVRVGLPDRVVRGPAELGYSQARLTDDILTACDNAVSDIVSRTMDELAEAREAAGDGATS